MFHTLLEVLNLVLLAATAAEIGYGVYCVARTSFTGNPTVWWLIPRTVGVEFYEE